MNRKFDKLGRIVIPKEMRDKLRLGEPGSEAFIKMSDDMIVISNPKQEDEFKKYLENLYDSYNPIRSEAKLIKDIYMKYTELKK